MAAAAAAEADIYRIWQKEVKIEENTKSTVRVRGTVSTLNVAKRMNGQKEEMEFRRKHMQRWPLKRLKVFKE